MMNDHDGSEKHTVQHLSRRLFLAGAGVAGLVVVGTPAALAAPPVAVHNERVRVRWHQVDGHWVTEAVEVRGRHGWRPLFDPAGSYSVLMSADRPDIEDVKRGVAGQSIRLLPEQLHVSRGTVELTAADPAGTLRALWRTDRSTRNGLLVTVTWTAASAGWYSVASPALATVRPEHLTWGVVPGFWTSSVLADADSDLPYEYGFGVPAGAYQAEERSATSLVAAIEGRHGTLAAVADPRSARDPWPDSSSNQSAWQVSMSLRDGDGALTPVVSSPVLGQNGSWLEAGESLTTTFRIMADPGSWYDVTDTVTSDVYDLGAFLALARNQDSLSHRLNRIHDFLVTPESRWHTWEFRGHQLGAESGKLSDVGGMWMWSRITGDPFIADQRLPFARGFKLAQQGTPDDGPFEGAALGEYFRDGEWISEIVWANRPRYGADYVSPMFTTFYMLADGGNILLFDPEDAEIRELVRRSADKLLAWQHPDGHFDIGYERANPGTVKFPELEDLRATWYGLVAAHRVLDDERYLAAARRGADWFVEHAVATGNILGVCDDTRLVPDFHVVFAAQALLDLYEITGVERYRTAAVDAANLYTTHVFDHPTATDEPKTFNGHDVEDWQLSQVGLAYEHAGYRGSSRGLGPITLSSHAGAFVRFYELTGRQIFLDLARASARGRHEWVGEANGIPSYYWNAGNRGSMAYPWHGWWHIGWVIDYLLAEAHLRSGGQVSFPHGLCTAKVGSHRPYGFAPGTIFGQPVELRMPRTLVVADDPSVEWVTAVSPDGSRTFVIALNESPEPVSAVLTLNPRALRPGEVASWGRTRPLTGSVRAMGDDRWQVRLEADGVAIFSVATTFGADAQGPELRSFTVEGPERRPTVAWSFWTVVTSRVQWRAGEGEWTSTEPVSGHTNETTIDLSGVQAPATVQVRIATDLPGSEGFSEPIAWALPLVGPNIALGRPVEVSSVYAPQYPGSNLVDGNTTANASRWLSAVGDELPTVTITLPAVTTPKLLRLFTTTTPASGILVSWTVQARTAAGAWVDVGAVTGNTAPQRDLVLDPVATDRIRVVVTDRSRDQVDVARIFEIQVYDQYEV